MGNGQYIKQVKSSKKLSVSSEDISSKGSTIKYDLNDLDSTGVINSSQLDLTKITGNRSDAAQGINYISESNLYKDIWESGKDFEYEIYDDGSILIKNDGVGIGFTNADGFQSILNEYYVENSDINIPDPLYEEKPEEQEIVLSEDEQRYVDLFISPTSNPNFSRNSVKEMFNPKKADRNPEAVGRGSIPYKDLGGGSYIRYYSTGYPQEFYNARTNQLTEYSADGKVLRRITYIGKPSEKKVSSFIEYSYNEEGNISKVTGLKGEVTEINYYYGKGGTVYKESVLKDGRHELISYDNDGKMVSKVIGEYDGTIHSSKSDLDIPKIKGDQSVYRDGKIREKYCTNGDYEIYEKNRLKERHLSNGDRELYENGVLKSKIINGVHINYQNGEIESISYLKETDEIALDFLNNEKINLDYTQISSIEKTDGKIDIHLQNGDIIHYLNNNSFIIKENSTGVVNYGYHIEADGSLTNIDMFNDYNIYNGQYGGNQHSFENNCWLLLQDPDIMNELRNHFPNATESELATYLCRITPSGCGYVGFANDIFNHYIGREEEFYNKFGFNMYKINDDGNLDYNYENLVLRWYDYIWASESVYTEGGGTSWDIMYRQPEFLAQYGITATYKEEYYTESASQSELLNVYDSIVSGEGEERVLMTAWNFDIYDMNGNLFMDKVGCHEMYVIGKTDNGNLIVSSWGNKYIVDLSTLEYNDGGMYFYKLDFEN